MRAIEKSGTYTAWDVIDVGLNAGVFIDNGGDDTQVMYLPPSGKLEANTIEVDYVSIHNRSGSARNLGFGVRLTKAAWRAGQWTHGSTTYTDDTTDFQSAAASDAALETTSANDGFLVQSVTPFNALSLAVGTASTGTPARVIEYSSAGGTWTTAPTIQFSGASANFGTGENLIWWLHQRNWVPMTALHGTNVTPGWYGIRVRATTAPTVAALATSVSVHRIYWMTNVPTNTSFEVRASTTPIPLDPNGEALVMCTNATGAVHRCSAVVRARG